MAVKQFHTQQKDKALAGIFLGPLIPFNLPVPLRSLTGVGKFNLYPRDAR